MSFVVGQVIATQDTASNLKTQAEGAGVAGTPAGGVLSVQGVSGGTPAPISAASLPLPVGAATASNQTDGGQKAIARGGAKGVTPAGDITGESIDSNIQALHVKVVSSSGTVPGTTVRIVDGSANPLDSNEDSAPSSTRGLVIAGWEETPNKIHKVAVDSQGRLAIVSAGLASSYKGFIDGRVVLATTAITAIRETAYTEQAANAQRSIVSASANDTAAGTGARTVRVTYYTATLTGPFTETVTLNGTTPVNTVASDICYIERIDVLTVGSNGSNVGVISLKAATGGGGVTVWSIAAASNKTYGAHHYVAAARKCYITGAVFGIKGADTSSGFLVAKDLGLANAAEKQISDFIRVPSSGQSMRTYGTPIEVLGGYRITAYTSPDSTSSRTYFGSFDYYEQ